MLAETGNAARFELFSEHHAEHRRFRRIFQSLSHEMGGRILGIDADMQLLIMSRLTDGQHDGLLVGLGYLVNAAAGQGVVEFLD